jgi:hypothetical protein
LVLYPAYFTFLLNLSEIHYRLKIYYLLAATHPSSRKAFGEQPLNSLNTVEKY